METWPHLRDVQRCSLSLSLNLGALYLCAPLTVASALPSLGLESDLRVRLHGQHLAQELVPTMVRSYLELPRPDKALALSFHGWSGTGKNFVARMLAENLYRDGLRSDCVKLFIATFHFPHPKDADLYEVRPGSAGQLCGPGRGWGRLGQPEEQLRAARETLKALARVGPGEVHVRVFRDKGLFRQNLLPTETSPPHR